jgi:hypothetical protein
MWDGFRTHFLEQAILKVMNNYGHITYRPYFAEERGLFLDFFTAALA